METTKRAAFCTSYLIATPKRGAFYTSILGGTPKRGAFSSSQVGAYCIRPIGRHPTDGECANRANYHDSSFHKWNVCGAYAIRPYRGKPKRGAFCTSYLVATPKRGAFCTSYLVATLKRAAFSSSQVGAYCIRPIGRHPTNGECANRANYHDSSLHKWNACRAYAIRPYMETPKRGAFCTSILGGTPKRGAFCTSILGGTPKRGAFCTSILDGRFESLAFFG